jgi:hypothetical protein
MKHLFLSILALLFFRSITAQGSVQETLTDAVLNQKTIQTSKTPLVIRLCSGEDSLQPLFMVDGKILSKDFLLNINPENITDLKVLKSNEALKLFGASGKQEVVLINNKDIERLDHHKKHENLPFKIYDVPTDNLNLPQDIYHRIISQVPGVQINNTDSSLNNTPTITIRGDRNTIYIIDGIRYYDASILNAINLSDIESIKVATDVAASNYLLTNRN